MHRRVARRFSAILSVSALVVVASVASSAASAAPPPRGVATARAAHERVVDYWTPGRRAAAIPLDVSRPQASRGKPPGTPGGGGGDDTDTSGSVTGAAWTRGGDVTRTTGKVFFNIGSALYVCSGSAVDSNFGSLVITAGHCVNDGNGGAFHTNWIFYPGYDGGPDPILGGWTATDLFTTTAWANTRNAFSDDVGLAAVVGDDPNNSLEAALAPSAIPTVVFDQASYDVDYTAVGYPAAKKYKGETLTYCAGPVTRNLDGDNSLAMACDMTGGSSGGPWFRQMESGTLAINSVNSYGYRSLKGYMFGPVFDTHERNAYTGANTSPDCNTSSAIGYVCTDFAD